MLPLSKSRRTGPAYQHRDKRQSPLPTCNDLFHHLCCIDQGLQTMSMEAVPIQPDNIPSNHHKRTVQLPQVDSWYAHAYTPINKEATQTLLGMKPLLSAAAPKANHRPLLPDIGPYLGSCCKGRPHPH